MTYPPIAIRGKFRAGKDEVARYLSDHYGYTRYAFADELKRYYYDLFPNEDESSKPREGLVWFGSAMRERRPSIWIDKMFEAIESDNVAYALPIVPVVSDLRLQNEYHRLKEEGYVIIEVAATAAIRWWRAKQSGDTVTIEDLNSETETALDGFDFDYTIENNGTLDELYAQIDAMMKELVGT